MTPWNDSLNDLIIYVDSDGVAIPLWPICGGGGDGMTPLQVFLLKAKP